MSGLFSSAATIKAPAAKGRKVEVAEIEVKGMERLAALDAAIKTLQALKEAEEVSVKAVMAAHWITEGTEKKDRPANFNGIEGAAKGSCQLKSRAVSSGLSDDEQKLLAANNIPFGTNVKTEAAFLINPKYTNDMAIQAVVEEALSSVTLPDDFLLKQEEISVKVATDESIKEVFQKSAATAELLLPVVTTMAIKPSIEGDFWSILDNIMNPVPEKVALDEAATAARAA
jgi:hypothetical protein